MESDPLAPGSARPGVYLAAAELVSEVESMRWIGRQLLATCMILLCGMFLAGAARAFSFGAEFHASDPDARIHRVTLFAPSRIPDELYRIFTRTNETFSDWPPRSDLGIGPKLAARRTRSFADGYDALEPASFAPRATFGGFDGVRFSTAGLGGHSAWFAGGGDPCPVVPEPGTLGLLGGGLVGIGLAGRRSRR